MRNFKIFFLCLLIFSYLFSVSDSNIALSLDSANFNKLRNIEKFYIDGLDITNEEFIYKPEEDRFGIKEFLEKNNSYLANYKFNIEGRPNEQITVHEYINDLSSYTNIDPRIILSLLEVFGGSVSSQIADGSKLNDPIGILRDEKFQYFNRSLGSIVQKLSTNFYRFYYEQDIGKQQIGRTSQFAASLALGKLFEDLGKREMRKEFTKVYDDYFRGSKITSNIIQLKSAKLSAYGTENFNIPFGNGQKKNRTQGLHDGGAYDFGWGLAAGQGDGKVIVSAADGVIETIVDTREGSQYPHPNCMDINNYITIKHSDNSRVKYIHIKKNSVSDLGLSEGDTISRGQVIAYMGAVGCATAEHLHYYYVNPQGIAQEPQFIENVSVENGLYYYTSQNPGPLNGSSNNCTMPVFTIQNVNVNSGQTYLCHNIESIYIQPNTNFYSGSNVHLYID